MFYLSYFAPVLLFIGLFVGSGLYFSFRGVSNAFYLISPLTAILPAIGLGWFLRKGDNQEKMNAFLDGIRHRDIITMCIIFLLAGAFSEVTKAIGSIDATVNLALSLLSPQYLLIGLFFVACFISTAIGTSMGTIATVAPIAVGICNQAGLSLPLGVATVVGGAMFGDNLSLISDTTIAAVLSQGADMKAKLRLNAQVAIGAAACTLVALFACTTESVPVVAQNYSLLLVTPYILLILLAICGINVLVAISISLGISGVIGFCQNPANDFLFLSQNITKGFLSMHEIMLLSLLVGGLSGLSNHGAQRISEKLSSWIASRRGGPRTAQIFIAQLASLWDILLANNTIAIIFGGEIAKDVAKKHHIPAHYSAAWLDIFSCAFQGILPYGAQVLLASTIAGVSPLRVTPHVYYCYALGAVALGFILVRKRL